MMGKNRSSDGRTNSLAFARTLAICLLAPISLSSCALIAPLNYNYHRRLWEKAFLDASMELNNGNVLGAEGLFQRALAESELLSSNDIRQAISLSGLARAYRLDQRDNDALSLLLRARSILEALLKAGRDKTADSLAEEELAGVLTDLAGLYLTAGQNEAAIDCCEEAIRLCDPLWQDKKSKLVGQVFARALFERAYLCQKMGRLDQSRDLYKRAFIIQYWSCGSSNGKAAILNGYRAVSQALGKPAQKDDKQEVQLSEAGEEVLGKQESWSLLLKDGQRKRAKGDHSGAEKAFADSLVVAEKLKLPPDCLVGSLLELARQASTSNNHQLAVSYLRKALKLLETGQATDRNMLASATGEIASHYEFIGDLRQAASYREKEIALIKAARGSDDIRFFKAAAALGQLYATKECDFSMRIVSLCDEVNEHVKTLPTRDRMQPAIMLMTNGITCCGKHAKWREAIKIALDRLYIAEKLYKGSERWRLIFNNHTLFQLYVAVGDRVEALRYVERIEKLMNEPEVSAQPDVVINLVQIAQQCSLNNWKNEALAVLDRAAELAKLNRSRLSDSQKEYARKIPAIYNSLGLKESADRWQKSMPELQVSKMGD